jgi:glycosyltransferase involved in cell wall biosynthesis
MDPRSIFVVVPCYNEARAIGPTLERLTSHGYSVVVVDDGSSDSSWEVIISFPVHALRHPINLGQGAALQTGMLHALGHGAEIIIHFDADGQHPVDQIHALIEPLLSGKADVVLGSRFLRDSDRDLVPPLKALVLRAAILVSGLTTGVWLSDTHNGFRALSRRAASQIRLEEPGFAHATEILGQIRRAGLRCVERPSTIRYSQYSMRKGQPILNSLNVLVDLCLRKFFK